MFGHFVFPAENLYAWLICRSQNTTSWVGAKVWPDIRFGRKSGLILDSDIIQQDIRLDRSDIQPYPTEIILPDFQNFDLLYQTTLKLSDRISSPSLVQENNFFLRRDKLVCCSLWLGSHISRPDRDACERCSYLPQRVEIIFFFNS